MFSIKNGEDKLFKVVLLFSFFSLLLALGIILRTGPAASYEFSVYDAYPWYFWSLILAAIFCGQLVILGSALTQSGKNYWIFGLGAILVANTLVLGMSLIRGYLVVSEGDILSHIGTMREILQTGGIGENFYPVDHILGVILHLFSGIPLPFIAQIIPLFFSFFFIASLYFVGKIIFPDTFSRLILVILSSVLLFGGYEVGFVPNAQAFFLVPLVLYAALKMNNEADNKNYYLLLLLVCFLIVFYHPLVTVMVIVILCLMQVIRYILGKYEKSTFRSVNYIYSIFFMVIVFTMWSTYLSLITSQVRPVIERFAGNETGQSELQRNIAIVSQVNLDPAYLLKLVFSIYGQFIILGLFSLLSIVLILKSIRDQKTKPDLYRGIAILGFILFSTLSVILLLVNGSFNFNRILFFSALFSVLLVPSGMYLMFDVNSVNPLRSIKGIFTLSIIILFFFSLTYFSLFNLFPSPIVKQTNPEVTKSEYTGMGTFFTIRDPSLHILEYLPSSFRYYEAIYGPEAKKVNIGMYNPDSVPPDHFGYQNETLSRSFYSRSQYLLVDARGRGFYLHVYPDEFKNKWRFFPKDFELLNFDDNVNKIYSNRNLEVFVTSLK
jgi:hypothetical protein